MITIFLSAASTVAWILLVLSFRKQHNLTMQVANAQLDATRFHRHMERLEMVLKECAPECLAQVKARSDMEWQQAVKGLQEGELPTFYSLEQSFTPIRSGNS